MFVQGKILFFSPFEFRIISGFLIHFFLCVIVVQQQSFFELSVMSFRDYSVVCLSSLVYIHLFSFAFSEGVSTTDVQERLSSRNEVSNGD